MHSPFARSSDSNDDPFGERAVADRSGPLVRSARLDVSKSDGAGIDPGATEIARPTAPPVATDGAEANGGSSGDGARDRDSGAGAASRDGVDPRDRAASERADASTAAARRARRGRVLVVASNSDAGPRVDDLAHAIAASGREVDVAPVGPEAERRALDGDFDVVVLQHDGSPRFELVGRLHARRPEVRVLVLTASRDPEVRVAGLGAGADEVFSAPHTVREVEARTTALLRRVISDDPSRVEVEEGLVVDIGRLQIERGGRTIVLTPLEAGILDHMLRHGHRVVTRRELLEAVWGEPDQQACERTIDVHVVSLRRKLSGGTGSQRLIRTVRGRGYRWGA